MSDIQPEQTSGHSELLKALHGEESITGLALYLWQEGAVQAWAQKNEKLEGFIADEEYRGIISAVTGSGKTVMAVECIWVWLQENPLGRVTVLVPTRALQRQWRKEMSFAFPNMRVGVIGGGRSDYQQISIATMNTAIKGLPDNRNSGPHMMVIDECHNIGSTQRRYAVLHNDHTAILGMSATPVREDNGLTVVGRLCGPVVYEYKYDQALEDEVIIPFKVRAVSVPLASYEDSEYNELTKEIRKICFVLKKRYGEATNFFTIKEDPNDPDGALSRFRNLCQMRKRLVNQAHFRFECVDEILRIHEHNKTMVFHERIMQLEWMHSKYSGICPPTIPDCENTWEDVNIEEPDCDEWYGMNPEIYHGNRAKGENDRAMESFAKGESKMLLSCKALREGVDVPDCDLGIMVSGTNAARARVQTLGRCLRRGKDKKEAIVYLLYVPNTTDAKGLANLKYGGRLPEGTIEWWRYHPSKGLRKVGEEEAPEKPKKPRVAKTKEYLCESCFKEFFTENASKSENHHCYPALTTRGAKPLDLWSDMIGRNR